MKRPAYLRLTGRSERVAVAGTVGSPAIHSPWHTTRGALAGLCTVAALLLALVSTLIVSGWETEADAQTAAAYKVTDLGTLGAYSSAAYSVNGFGHVVGESRDPDSWWDHAFLYDTSSMRDLGTLGGNRSAARGISDAGHVVGWSEEGQNYEEHAFLYEAGQGMRDLGTLGGHRSEARGVNDAGQVVGWSRAADNQDHAFLYEGNSMRDLGVLPGGNYSRAYDINGSGQVVGDSNYRAVLWDDGGMRELEVLLPEDYYSYAYGINDLGHVVGESTSGGFLWKNETRIALGDIRPAAVNDAGQVVGTTSAEVDGCWECVSYHASIWQAGQLRDLNDLIDPASGWELNRATDINDKGQIVGTGNVGTGFDSETHAFLLTPDPNAPPVDSTEPTVEIATPADGATYSLNAEVRADYSCADEGGSGLASCDGPVASGDPIDTSTPGPGSFRVVATDGAGNTHSVTHNYEVVVPPSDVTPPAITITTPEDDAEYKLGQVVAADYSCSDEGSGVASCVGSVPDGDNLDTASVGPKTLTVDAADVDGNTASASHGYSVVYDFGNGSGGGFLAPVDGFPTMNAMKAGATVPVKFALGGDQGLDIFTEGYPVSRRISCGTQLPTDPVEELVTASDSGLKYDAAAGHYSYNWKTNKRWTGTCRQLVLKLKDGTEHPLNFQFK